MPETFGTPTRNVFEYGPQAHKLMLEFASSAAIEKGQLVVLDADGRVSAAPAGVASNLVIGVCIHTVAAADILVTVAMRGYVAIWGVSGGALAAGPVELGAYNATLDRPVFAAAASAAVTVGHNLDQAAATDEEVKVCIL